MFSQKSRAYDYRDPSILTLPKYNTITHGKKCFMYEGAKLWNSIGNGIKTIENISEFKMLLKKWNGSLGGSNYDSLFVRTVAFPVQVAYWI